MFNDASMHFILLSLILSNSSNGTNMNSYQLRVCSLKLVIKYDVESKFFYHGNWHISDFNSYKKLDLKCIAKETSRRRLNEKVSYFLLEPNRKLIINDELNLNVLNHINTYQFYTIGIKGVKGVELNSDPFEVIAGKNSTHSFYLYLYDVRFVYFYNNLPVKDSSAFENFYIKIFANIKGLMFMDDTIYAENVSPYLFKNVNLSLLTFGDLSDTFLRINRLSFSDRRVNSLNSNCSRIKVKIKKLAIKAYNYNLNRKLLNKCLFESLDSLRIDGHLANLHHEAFKIFKSIRSIYINLMNMRDFYRRHLKAIYGLNEGVYIDYRDQGMLESIASYESKKIELHLNQNMELIEKENLFARLKIPKIPLLYPNEDICLFRDFPFHRLIYPIIIQSPNQNCSCLQLWLMRYNNYSDQAKLDYRCSNAIVDTSYTCNYTQMLSICDVYKFRLLSKSIPKYDYDILYSDWQTEQTRYSIRLADMLFYTFVFPLVGCVGFLLNLLNVLVLRNKECLKELKKRLYKFMLLNSTLNCMICLLSAFQFTVRCTTSSGRFCVDTEYNLIARCIYLIVFNYLLSVLKMASNCAHFFTSLDRYVLCIKDTKDEKESKLAQLYKKLKLRSIIKSIILVCLMLNLIKLFQYNIRADYFFDLKTFPLVNVYFYSNSILNSLNIFIYTLLNNFAFLLLTLILDVLLYLFLRRSIRAKAKLTANSVRLVEFERINSPQIKPPQINQDDKFLRLVIFNGVFYFVFHIFDLVVSITLSSFNISFRQKSAFFRASMLDNYLVNLKYIHYLGISDTISLFSYFYYFFIFYFYDKNFRLSLNILLNRN
jgi:hypothetical protein